MFKVPCLASNVRGHWFDSGTSHYENHGSRRILFNSMGILQIRVLIIKQLRNSDKDNGESERLKMKRMNN